MTNRILLHAHADENTVQLRTISARVKSPRHFFITYGELDRLQHESMSASRPYGVELDGISGRIAQQLYPKANITIAGFETTDRKDFFDVAVGNVPFGQYQVHDPAYDKHNFSIHNYFLCKTLDQLRPGGIMAVVTSHATWMPARSKSGWAPRGVPRLRWR